MSVRTDLTKDILELCDDYDPSGKNRRRMKEFLDKMDDAKFSRYMKDFLSDPNQNFTFAIEPFESKMTFEDYVNIGLKYNISMYERVYRPAMTMDNENPPGSQELILVLDVEVKRLQQLLHKKNSSSTSISKRNPKTNQVSDDDKNASASDNEILSFFAQGREACAFEFAGFRADDMLAKTQAYKDIQSKGEVHLSELTHDPLNRATINTMYYYMLGSGIGSNFIEPTGYVLPITLKGKDEKVTTIRQVQTGQ